MGIAHNRDNTFPTTPLSTRVVRGGMWVFTLRVLNRGLGFIRTIILARLLAPEDFGLFGIAMLAIATLETFSQTGFQPALIQKKEKVDQYLDTAWTAAAVRGIILFLVLFVTAPLVADFFKAPKTIQIIRIIAITTLLSGFRNIGILFFQKELKFKMLFAYEFPATLTDLGVSITLAVLLRDVRALIYGGLAAGVVRLFLSYGIHPFRPRLRIETEKLRDLFDFGKWVFLSSILIFLLTHGDDILVGRVLGTAALGFFQMAYLLSNLPATEITHVISNVTFPAYSTLKDDLPKFRLAYLKVLKLTGFVSIPLAGGIFLFAGDFTRIFLGSKWIPIVPALQILCLFGVTRAIGATMGPILYSIGKPKIQTILSFIQLIIMAAIIYPCTVSWGITGTALAVVIPNAVALLLITVETKKNIGIGYKAFFETSKTALITVLFLVFSISLIRQAIALHESTADFVLFGFSYIFIYVFSVCFLDRSGYRITAVVREIMYNLGLAK